MRTPKQLRKIGSQPHDGALLHRFDVAAKQIRFEVGSRRCVSSRTRRSPLARSCHSWQKRTGRSRARIRLPLAEVQMRDGGRPRRDVRRQQPRLAYEGVDERALAGLDLPHDGDAKHLLAKPIDRLADQRWPAGSTRPAKERPQFRSCC